MRPYALFCLVATIALSGCTLASPIPPVSTPPTISTKTLQPITPSVSQPITVGPKPNHQWRKYEHNPIIETGDKAVWNAATYDNGTFYVFTGGPFEGTQINLWTSSDSVHFVYQGLALPRGDDKSWDYKMMEPHSVIHFNGEWRVYYCGMDDAGIWRIGYAYGDTLDHLTKYERNPVFVPSKDEVSVADPHTVVWQNKVWMFYHDYGSIYPYNQAEHVAWSDDGRDFTRVGDSVKLPSNWSLGVTGDLIALDNDTLAGVMVNYEWGKSEYRLFTTQDAVRFNYADEPMLLQGWRWLSSQGMVMGGAWDGGQLAHCSLVRVNDTLYLFYAGKNSDDSKRAIGLATINVNEVDWPTARIQTP